MAKIILVDTDANYLSNLEWYFIKQPEEHEIITISSREYLEEFFSRPQTADALVIAEDMFSHELEKHNITHFFTLTERDMQNVTDRLDGKKMSKFTTSIPEMYNIITGILKNSPDGGPKNAAMTTVILTYSPVGGVGATSTAVGLCASLYKNYKKVLFLSAEGLQTFGAFFSGDYFLDIGQTAMFKGNRQEIIKSLQEMTRSELCDYLPPFNGPLPSIPIVAGDFLQLINAVREKKVYEYIVIDTGNEFTKDISILMGAADKAVIIFDPEKRSEYKIKCLRESINCSDREKYVFLCNKFSYENGPCDLELELKSKKYTVNRIEYSDNFPSNINDFLGYKGFQDLTNSVL